MSLQAERIEKIKRLPEDKPLLVKSLVDELARRLSGSPDQPAQPWFGCLEHLGLSITEEDIAEARREMRCDFPRD